MFKEASVMKKMIVLCIILSFDLIGANAQSINVGINTGYIFNHSTWSPTFVDVKGTRIIDPYSSSSSFRDGWHFDVFTELEGRKWLAKGAISHSFPIGSHDIISIDNRDNPTNRVSADNWTNSYTDQFSTWELAISGGYKPLKWMRLWAGLSLWNKSVYDPEENYIVNLDEVDQRLRDFYYNENKKKRFDESLQNSIEPWVLYQSFAIEFIESVVSMSFRYDASLTPISKGFTYENDYYDFYRYSHRFVFSLGISLSDIKRKHKRVIPEV